MPSRVGIGGEEEGPQAGLGVQAAPQLPLSLLVGETKQ